MANYAWTTGKSLPEVADGAVIERMNLHQREPHTPVFVGKTGLTFRRCNLINCDVPDGSVIDDCLRAQISHCTNLHPKWADKGLTVCPQVCEHVVDSDTIIVDSVVVDTVYHYEDKAVS